MGANDALVRLDLNNPVFQETLFNLQKAERHAAIDTLRKVRQLTWAQVYRDNGLKWGKIITASFSCATSAAKLSYWCFNIKVRMP